MLFERVKENIENEILNIIERDYGIKKDVFKNFIFLMAGKHKVYIMHKKNVRLISLYNINLNCNRVGLLLGEIDKRGFRFSIDGSHFFGRYATKNIYKINEEEAEDWLKGLDLDIDYSKFINYSNNRYILIFDGKYFYGSGLVMGSKIKNMVPKIRRIKKLSDL